MPTKSYRYISEEELEARPDKLLRDGEVLRVKMTMADAMRVPVTDGAGNSGLSLHKPGFRISNTVTRDGSIYDAYDAQVASAYRNVGAVESEFRGRREGDARTAKSDQGRDGSTDSKLSDAVRDEREAAHLEYRNRIQNAWKDGR
jgi:hypothetical protein